MKKTVNFEQSLKELEDIVHKLEDGELTLEESLEMFQKGVNLSGVCTKMLDEAEQKVNMLVKQKDGEFAVQAFGVKQEEADGEF